MPHSLHKMNLAAHVADLCAALENTERKKAWEPLELLKGDPIAQIMSFMPCREERRGLRAVSPQMRLDSEVMADESHIWRSKSRMRVYKAPLAARHAVANGVLCFSFITDSKESSWQQIVLSLWWARRCGLPVELSISRNNSEVLAHLDDTLRSRVKSLEVTMRRPPTSAADDAAVSSSTSRVTTLALLLSLANLQQVWIQGKGKRASALEKAEALSVLQTAASLPVRVLKLDGYEALYDLSSFAGSRFLCGLTVMNSGLRSLEGVNKYSMLETLTIVNCAHLTSASALAELPRLQEVAIRRCNLHSLDGLDRCMSLKRVNVSYNSDLQGLSPLASAPLLEMIVACGCDIRSVQGLGSCAALIQVNLTFNSKLQCLGDLSRAPVLRRVLASKCGLRDLGEDGPWSALQSINVSYNRDLQSLSGLAGAPLLEQVSARGCSIQDSTELETCPKLSKVFE